MQRKKKKRKGIIGTATTPGYVYLYCQQPCSGEELLGKGGQLVKSQKKVNATRRIQLSRHRYVSAESENSYIFL